MPSQADAEIRVKEERSFRQGGEGYLGEILPLENNLSHLENSQDLGNVVKNLIQNLGREISNDPELTKLVLSYRKSINEKAENNANTFKNKLKDFIKENPNVKFLLGKAENEQQQSKTLDIILDRIARYSQAIVRADEINSSISSLKNESTKKTEEVRGRAGQISYRFDRFLDLSAEAILNELSQVLPEGSSFSDLDEIICNAQVEIIVGLDEATRFYSLLNWVVQTARRVRTENLKIFDTPETNELLFRLKEASKQHNGLGGAILFGPPGTGKTELLVERNRKMGFDSRVISIHHFSDYAQLIGERPVPIGMDNTTSQAQRLTLVEETISRMSNEEKKAFIMQKFSSGSEGWQNFLKLAQVGEVKIDSADQIKQEVVSLIVESLTKKIKSDIANIGLGVQEGLDEETAWAKGEIIQAFDEGRLPILDEMDKASEHSLDGISRLLNLPPGSTIMLGNQEYIIPNWARIDGTANAMNLAPFLHDRFAPNVIFVDYPSAQDTLLKSLVWLSNEQGVLELSADKQQKFVGLALYVFPEIQKLYPKLIEHPLSNRGIRKFCQMITSGESISSALNELLLKPGALTNSEKGLAAIQAILDRFPSLTTPAISLEQSSSPAQKSDIMQSVLYESIVDYFLPFDETQGSTSRVVLSLDKRESLLKEKESSKEISSDEIDTKVETTIGVEWVGDSGSLVVRCDGKLLTKVAPAKEAPFSKEATVVSSDNSGQFALVNNNNVLTLVEVATGKTKTILTNKENASYDISGDGKFVLHQVGKMVSITSTRELLDREGDEIKTTSFINKDGEQLQCRRQEVSKDGSFMLIETILDETYVINLNLLRAGQKLVMLSQPFVSGSNWQLTRGNILINKDSEEAFLLKA